MGHSYSCLFGFLFALFFGFFFFIPECVLIYISSWEEGCEKFRCRGQRGEKGGSWADRSWELTVSGE